MVTRVNQYKIVKKLGQGGMAKVFLATDDTGKKFALKLMDEDFVDDKVKLIRFYNEAKAINKLSHPNIIKIIEPPQKVRVEDEGKQISTLMYVMEYVNGNSLRRYIQENKLAVDEIVRLYIDILDAIGYCHKLKIYHRDLKPANILVKKNQLEIIPIITDFGIAKFKGLEVQKGVELTTDGIKALGAPAYMSPEQIYDPRKVTSKSDLYSIGIMLYESLTGNKPFVGTYQELIKKQLNENPIPPSKINPAIDGDLEKVILQLLEKDPQKRPSSAYEVKELLMRGDTSLTLDSKTIIAERKNISSNSESPFYKYNYFLQIKNKSRKNVYSFYVFPILLGRGRGISKNFYSISDSSKISFKHGIIERKENEFFYKDISKIGSKINGRKILHKTVMLNNESVNKFQYPDGTELSVKIVKTETLNPIIIIVPFILIIILLTIIFSQ